MWQLVRRPNHTFDFYLHVIPPALGWGVVILAAVGLIATRRERSWREILLVSWILVPAVFFELWPVKGFQYLLPIAPAVALVAARGLVSFIRWPRLHTSRALELVAVPLVVLVLFASLAIPTWRKITPSTSGAFLAGSGGLAGGREAGHWIDRHVPLGSQLLALGPSMANVVMYYGHRQAYGLSVSTNPLHRNPVYIPLDNPDRAIREGQVQYLVWDSYTSGRSSFYTVEPRALHHELQRPAGPHRAGPARRPALAHRREDLRGPAVRRLTLAAAAAIVGASIASLVPSTSAMGAPRDGGTPAPAGVPTTTPVHHFVTMLQENHSFDNYFGTYPGADGLPTGTCVPVDPAATPPGECVKPFLLDGKASPRIASNQVAFDQAYDNGKLDGFVTAQSGNGHTEAGAMGYYDGNSLPFYWHLANRYVLFDHLFSSSSGGTLWNHLYWMTGSDGGLTDERIPEGGLNSPTIFDRLQAAGVSWKIYVENYDDTVNIDDPATLRKVQLARVPVLAMRSFADNPSLMSHVVKLDQYYSDLAKGQLPAVSYIVPSGSSEHPPSKLHSGPLLVNRLVGALERSSAWPQSAFLLSYDDAGGFYDHVVPPTAAGSSLGFRVPALLVSPFAPVGKVNHTTLETASIPGFIEDNWNLAPLTTRDASAGRLTTAFDFKQPPRRAETVPFTRITAPLSLPAAARCSRSTAAPPRSPGS